MTKLKCEPVAKPPPVPQERSPRTLATFQCTECEHVGIGRLDALVALACSGCGRRGTAREAPVTRRVPDMARI